MKKHYSAWLVASVLASVCGGIYAAATAEVGNAPGTDPRLDMSSDGGKTWRCQGNYHMMSRRAILP